MHEDQWKGEPDFCHTWCPSGQKLCLDQKFQIEFCATIVHFGGTFVHIWWGKIRPTFCPLRKYDKYVVCSHGWIPIMAKSGFAFQLQNRTHEWWQTFRMMMLAIKIFELQNITRLRKKHIKDFVCAAPFIRVANFGLRTKNALSQKKICSKYSDW